MTLADEPPCWGMEGAELLPPEWQRQLPDTSLPLPPKGEKFSPSAADLCRAGWFHKVVWSVSPADLALRVAEGLFRADDLDFADHPILSGRFARASDVARLPLLWSTVEAIGTASMGDQDLALALTQGTALELYQRLRSLSAVIDLVITSRSWTVETASGFRSIVQPSVPADVEEAFLLAQIRLVRQAGGTGLRIDPSTQWPQMLGARVGCSVLGPSTLEEAAALGGVTRERVRQVTNQLALGHELFRRWPAPPSLQPLLHRLCEEPMTDEELERALEVSEVPVTFRTRGVLARMALDYRGRSLIPTGGTASELDLLERLGGLTRSEVRATAWQLSEKSGFLLRADLAKELSSTHPEVPVEVIEDAISHCVDMPVLPLGHVFCGYTARSTVVETSRKMLDWAEVLPVDAVRRGLDRRSRFRGLPSPPPTAVLLSFFVQHDDFLVDGRNVMSGCRRPPVRTTVEAWIAESIQRSPYGVLHRTVLFDLARQAGMRQASVMMYSTYSPLIEPAGKGCVSLVGSVVDPAQVALAQADAAVIRVPHRVVSETSTGDLLRLTVQPGNALLDSGVLAVRRAVAKRCGKRSFVVLAEGKPRGELKVTGAGNAMVSLASALHSLGVEPIDLVDITLDFTDGTATVELHWGQAEPVR